MTSFTVDIHLKMRSLQRLFQVSGPRCTGASNAVSIHLLQQLNYDLMLQSFLQHPTNYGEKDHAMFTKLHTNALAMKAVKELAAKYPHLVRWFKFMQRVEPPKASHTNAKATAATPTKGSDAADQAADENKLTLPDAEHGKVVTRFPPEASGFMHIGHAKAALINSMLRDKYSGKMVFRFDDTNPAKEKESFEHAIEEDLAWMGIKADIGPTFTSDHFDIMLKYCDQMLSEGRAYVDFTPVEEMRKYREDKIATPCRSHSIERNIQLWEEMKKGTELGQTCCVRAKIDIASLNGTMRDPTMYRVVLIPHARTGRKYNVYPTYDFACPIVDSIEGITHALRTVEYRDRNEQYYWFIEALHLRRPLLDDYSRLNMEYTVMSKRKLAKLVEDGSVEGWDDPRFPTVRALARKGLYPQALRQFIEIQGMSKVVNVMEWNKLWTFNTRILDPSVPRFTAVSKTNHTIAHIEGEIAVKESTRLRHKKNESLGTKPVYFDHDILLESADVALLKDGEEITLMDWGNAFVRNLKADSDGRVTHCTLQLNPEGDVKKTKYKLSWLSKTCPSVPVHCVEFDNILTVKKPDPEDPNFDKIVNRNSKFFQELIGEGIFKELKKGDKLQIERRGYYIVDATSPNLVLFAIPEGGIKVNHLSAKAAAGFGTPATTAAGGDKAKGGEGMTLEQKRAEKAAQKAAQKKSSK